MAFGIIRARNLSAGDIGTTDKHNARKYSTPEEYPKNIKINHPYYADYRRENHEDYLGKNETTLQESLDFRLKKNNVKGIRKNSNLGIEYVCTINDKKAWDKYSFSGFVANTQTWLEDRHGKNSVIATYSHEDESNPHVHFVVVPLVKKEINWKNKNGQGVRTETRLNTREFTGGRDKLRALQDDYFSHLSERYGVGEDNKLGVPLYRGTRVEHQFREYSQQTNDEIGVLRNELANLTEELAISKKQFEIDLKQADFKQKEIDFNNKIKIDNDKTRKNWGQKGLRDNPVIFHTEKEHQNAEKREVKKSRRFRL